MGAAGRDFHDFLVRYRDDDSVDVVAFTATQIPGIDCRVFPAELAGPLYPHGIPIVPETDLVDWVRRHDVGQVVFAYSDVSHTHVMHIASLVNAEGADFVLLGPESVMLRANVPVISVCAVRTGAGKSSVTEYVCRMLAERGLTPVVLRHPMPYRDLLASRVERFATIDDLDAAKLTVEEREEYEHFVEQGIVVYAGVDYRAILRAAEAEASVVLWDGGNNDSPFIKPDLEIVVLDPHRAGHEREYHPGETNFLRANVLVVNKTDSAPAGAVDGLIAEATQWNPRATVVRTESRVRLAVDPSALAGKRALVIEDGPTVTHGGMGFGAGVLAAREHGATLVDPRPHAHRSIAEAFARYGHLTKVLPAIGYSPEQLADLERTIADTPCDVVVVATPIDLSHVIRIDQPAVRVRYEVTDAGEPTLRSVVNGWLASEYVGGE
ncbi:MAG: GTPase [Actinobacteria bacterium]|nr:MAG: GTPase [Actinomycetota bacterium]